MNHWSQGAWKRKIPNRFKTVKIFYMIIVEHKHQVTGHVSDVICQEFWLDWHLGRQANGDVPVFAFFLHACRLLPYAPGCLHKTSYIPSPCLSQTSALAELGQCGGHSLSHCRGWIQPLHQHTSMCQFSFMANLQSSRAGAREHPEMFSPPPPRNK